MTWPCAEHVVAVTLALFLVETPLSTSFSVRKLKYREIK